MAKTLIGVFDDKKSAENAVRELQLDGIPADHLSLMGNNQAAAAASKDPNAEPKWSEKIAHWFASLGEDDSDKLHAQHYAEAWRRGLYIVTADVDNNRVDRTAAIMNRYGTVNIGQRVEQWKKSGYTATPEKAKAFTAEAQSQSQEVATIPVVQEEIVVGKRVVQRGGVHIHSYVEERTVEEVVRLREERINVLRRPVDRQVTEADAAFKELTVDVNAMAEEPTIEKRARVVEEVVVNKDIAQHDETIKETVRRRDVTVQSVPAAQRAGVSAPAAAAAPSAAPVPMSAAPRKT